MSPCVSDVCWPLPAKRHTNTKTCCVWGGGGVLHGAYAPYSDTHAQAAECSESMIRLLSQIQISNMHTQTATYMHTQPFSSRCPRPHLRTHTPAASLTGQELKPAVIRTNPCLAVSLRGWVPVTLTTWNYNPNGMSGVSSVSKRTMRIYFLLWTCPLRDLPQKQEVTWWLAFLQPN